MIITTKKFDSTYMCVNKLFIADIRLTIMPLVTEINVGITAHDQSFDRLKQTVRGEKIPSRLIKCFHYPLQL